MTMWGVITRTRGNTSATGTVKQGKAKKPENPERKGKPEGEGEGKAGEEERKNSALSRRRKIFSVICG
jgi:hypothetical protein